MADSSNNANKGKPPTRYVAIDTTELFSCPYLDSPRWMQLIAFLQRTKTNLLFPEVVVAEAKRHFRKCLTDAHQDAKTAARQLNRLLRTNSVGIPQFDIEKCCRDYELELKRLLNNYNAILAAYSEVSITVVMERCLAKKRPFDSNGQKGFRDAVIWESILRAVDVPSDTIFVTRNKTDFGNHGDLHESLRQEISGTGRSIKVCNGLDKFVDEFVKPVLSTLDNVRPLLEDRGFLYDLLAQAILGADVTDEARRQLIGDICAATINNVPSVDSEFGDVYDLGGGLLSCSVTFTGHCDVTLVEAEYEGPCESFSYHAFELPARLDFTVEITFRVTKTNEIDLQGLEHDAPQIEFDL